MLTLTAILIGLCLLSWIGRVAAKPVCKGGDVVSAVVSLTLVGLVVWQFYFVMLPAAWGN